jgi:hypothetical protein
MTAVAALIRSVSVIPAIKRSFPELLHANRLYFSDHGVHESSLTVSFSSAR